MPSIPGFAETIRVIQGAKYARWPKETASDCVDILLDDAVYRHGLIPKTVFEQVLYPVPPQPNPPLPSDILRRIGNLSTEWNFAVYGLSTSNVAPEVIAIRTQPNSLTRLQHTDFFFVIRSAAVWEQLQQCLFKTAITQIEETFRSLRTVGSGAVLAGHIFAEYALNRITQDNPPLSLKPMARQPSSNSVSPLFTSDLEEMWDEAMDVEMKDDEAKAPVPHSVRPAVQFMPTRGRTVQAWSEQTYTRGEPNSLMALGRVIFVPVTTNHPLFDAFFLDVPDEANRVLWVIQFTTRQNHKGSSEGFYNVRQLMKQAGHKQDIDGSGSMIDVEVRWVLMTPTTTDKSEREWQMPAGWDRNTFCEDHRGSVWLQELDFK